MDKRLPTEILFEIFRLLSVAEQIKCRLISPTIRNVIDNLRPKRLLIVHNEEVSYLNGRWAFINEPINKNDVIISRRCPPGLLMRTTFRHLKRLFMSLNYEKIQGFIPMINQLEDLEQLSICDAALAVGRQFTLRLPNLLMLSLCNISFASSLDSSKLRIDAARLAALKCDSLGNSYHHYYDFVHPNSIVYLELKAYDHYAKNFKNLKSLSFSYSRVDNVSDFAKLKEINMWRDPLKVNANEMKLMISQFEVMEAQLSVETIFYEQRDLRLSINGYPVAGQFRESNQSIQQLYAKSPMAALTFVETVNYTEIEQLYMTATHPRTLFENPNGKRPNEFIFKFPNIRTVKASHTIVNTNIFFDFLANCKCLNKLKLLGGLDSQAHFDQLPEKAPTVTRLIIDFQPNTANNLEFLLKFRYLMEWRMNVNIDMAFIQQVFGQLRFFRTFTYSDKELRSQVSVQRKSIGCYVLSIDEKEKQFADLGNVWEYLHLFKEFGRRR